MKKKKGHQSRVLEEKTEEIFFPNIAKRGRGVGWGEGEKPGKKRKRHGRGKEKNGGMIVVVSSFGRTC